MKTKIVIALLGIAAVLAWTGIAGAQTASPAPKVQLPSGETVWDLSGDWEAVIENYGPGARHGTGTNVYRLTQRGSAFQAMRMTDDPLLTKEAAEHGHAPWGRAGSPSLQGELENTANSEPLSRRRSCRALRPGARPPKPPARRSCGDRDATPPHGAAPG